MISQSFVPLGYQQLTLTGTAQKLTVPTGATVAVIAVETANARWRDDGVAPTASVGVPMATTDSPLQYSGTLTALQFIAQTGSPILDCSFYRTAG